MTSPPRSLFDLPAVTVTPDDEAAGRVATLQARAAGVHGPVVHGNIPSGLAAGPCAWLIGTDALNFACLSGRDLFSSAHGWLPLLGRRFGQAVLNADEPDHGRDRRIWGPEFAPSMLARHLETLRRLVVRHVTRWRDAPSVDIGDAARELAFVAVATTIAGLPDDQTLWPIAQRLSAVLEPCRTGETEADKHARVAPLRDELDRLLDAAIGAQRGKPASAGLIARLRDEFPGIGDDRLRAHVNLLLIAGQETTSTLLSWLLHRFATDAPVRERLRAEAQAAPAEPSLAELEALPFLDAVVHETARFHTPLVNAPRVTVADVTMAGVSIPAGTRVALALGATNRLPERYGDAERFRPGRFIDPPDPTANLPVTFGDGARACLGRRFARLEAKALLHQVARAVRLECTDPSQPVHAGFWNARPQRLPRLVVRG